MGEGWLRGGEWHVHMGQHLVLCLQVRERYPQRPAEKLCLVKLQYGFGGIFSRELDRGLEKTVVIGIFALDSGEGDVHPLELALDFDLSSSVGEVAEDSSEGSSGGINKDGESFGVVLPMVSRAASVGFVVVIITAFEVLTVVPLVVVIAAELIIALRIEVVPTRVEEAYLDQLPRPRPLTSVRLVVEPVVQLPALLELRVLLDIPHEILRT